MGSAILAWLFAGVLVALFCIPWQRLWFFCRALPLPSDPAKVNASRVAGTLGMAAVVAVFWPLYLWLKARGRLWPDVRRIERAPSAQ